MNTTGSRPDPGISAASTSNSVHNTRTSSNVDKKRTKPTCAKCRNHGISCRVIRHKRFCPYRYCRCVLCHVVAEGGRIRALQLLISRRLQRQRKANRNPPPEPKLQSPSPCGEGFTNSGPTTADAPVPDMPTIRSGRDLLSSGSASGTFTNNVSSIIQPPQQYLTFLPPCCHNVTNHVPQSQATTPTNSTVPNVPSVCMYTVSPGAAKAPVTNFHSIDSLSSSSSNNSGTQPVSPSAWTNVVFTSPPQFPCENLSNYWTGDEYYYNALKWQQLVNSAYLNGNNLQPNSSALLC